MDPEDELSNKRKKEQMRRKEIQLSLDFERKAGSEKDPELKGRYNKLAQEHSRNAMLLRD